MNKILELCKNTAELSGKTTFSLTDFNEILTKVDTFVSTINHDESKKPDIDIKPEYQKWFDKIITGVKSSKDSGYITFTRNDEFIFRYYDNKCYFSNKYWAEFEEKFKHNYVETSIFLTHLLKTYLKYDVCTTYAFVDGATFIIGDIPKI